MGLFKYPYTDLNELNLDWVIARIKELTEYVATITNADQISYDNTGTILSAENVQTAINEILNVITTGAVTSFNGRTGAVVPASGDYDANIINYNNANSGLSAAETQSAIDELAARPLGGVQSFNGRTDAVVPAAGDYDADDITYDNTVSGLTATDTQAAIDELDNRLDNFTVNASQVSYDNTQTGLTATDAQAAIDEIANDVLSSGVASFNGRTGAVNPTAGDYNASQVNYDGTNSGLVATDAQSAIDEIVTDLTGKYAWVEDHVITNSAHSDTRQKRLNDMSAAVLAYLQALPNDEFCVLGTFNTNQPFMPSDSNVKYTNAATAFNERFSRVTTSSGTFIIQFTRIAAILNNCEFSTCTLASTPTITIADTVGGTDSNNFSIHLERYKKIA